MPPKSKHAADPHGLTADGIPIGAAFIASEPERDHAIAVDESEPVDTDVTADPEFADDASPDPESRCEVDAKLELEPVESTPLALTSSNPVIVAGVQLINDVLAAQRAVEDAWEAEDAAGDDLIAARAAVPVASVAKADATRRRRAAERALTAIIGRSKRKVAPTP